MTNRASLDDGTTLFLDGQWTGAKENYERVDPADLGRRTGIFASATAEHVDLAYAAASSAQPAWAATPAPARAEILRCGADLLETRVEEATAQLTADMGKAHRDARSEVLRSVAILRYFAGELLAPSGELYPSADSSTTLFTIEEPLGVICAITPWNFPSAIPVWKLAPAVGFGNTVVWKPAEAASGSAVLLCEILDDAGIPPGVINLITGSGRRLSRCFTDDLRLAALTFTGSAGVGQALRLAVADRNVKVQLELGGKNPAIVLADADLPDAAAQITRGAMFATGQRCTATSRVYVERSVAEKFRRLLLDEVGRLVVGDPFDPDTDVGPLGSVDQRDTVAEYLQLARDEGVEVLAGGTVSDETCFMDPTVLAGVSPDSALLVEEIFGAVLVLVEVDDFDQALAAANSTEFGLSSAVFTSDLTTAMRFVRETESGVVHINRETTGVEPHVPFGGMKASSNMNREQGTAARQFFTTTKTVYLRTV
jgi:acyl-CoA reductase-like NAD-dependent aldehyde dehydrogenase